MPWMRRVEVIVTPKEDPSKKVVFDSHRIDFEVRSTVGWPADTANITLYNLSIPEVKSLQNKNFGDLFIEIRAGYREGGEVGGIKQYDKTNNQVTPRITIEAPQLPTVFSGIITNAVGYRRAPEHITQLFCISKAYGASTEFKQMTALPDNITVYDAIKSMCKDYGFNTISSFGVSDDVFQSKLPHGRVFHDTFLEEFKKFLGEYNLLFTMTTGEIQIFPDTYGDKDAVDRMAKNREAIKIDANQVIGNPIAGICTYMLSTFLNPSFQPGMVIDVSPLLGKELLVNGFTAVNGQGILLNTDQSVFRWAMENRYFLMEVVHRGSTHAQDFMTSLTAIIGGNTAMGGKEAAWQQMYANSGMAMESF